MFFQYSQHSRVISHKNSERLEKNFLLPFALFNIMRKLRRIALGLAIYTN